MMGRLLHHIPNAITLLRPVLACVLVALLPDRFGGGSAAAPMIVFASICLTDFIDGRLARGMGAVSEAGVWLDLICDFFYIAASLVALNVLGQTPVWFTAAVFVKFIEYIVTSHILRRNGEVFIPDRIGRIAAGMFFVIPGFVCAFFDTALYPVVLPIVLYSAGSLALISSVARWVSCAGIMGKRGAVQRGVSR